MEIWTQLLKHSKNLSCHRTNKMLLEGNWNSLCKTINYILGALFGPENLGAERDGFLDFPSQPTLSSSTVWTDSASQLTRYPKGFFYHIFVETLPSHFDNLGFFYHVQNIGKWKGERSAWDVISFTCGIIFSCGWVWICLHGHVIR